VGGDRTADGEPLPRRALWRGLKEALPMNRIIYIVGLIVVVLAVLWFFGMR
jgi:hypothetical protein